MKEILMSDEIEKKDEVVTISKVDFDSLVSKLDKLETIISNSTQKEVAKEDSSRLTEILQLKQEENNIKEQAKHEYELNLFFQDLPREELFSEDEVLVMDKLNSEEVEIEKLKKMSANDKVLKFMPTSQRKEIEKVFKDGSTKDKLNIKYKFIDSYKEAYAKFKDVQAELLKKEKEAEERYGLELSKKGISTNNNNQKRLTIDDIRNEDVKKVFAKFIK